MLKPDWYKCSHNVGVLVQFKGTSTWELQKHPLRGASYSALDSLLSHSNGVLNAPTAFGKTVVAIALISRLKVNTLVLVHTRSLLCQWRERLEKFLCFLDVEISQNSGRKKTVSPVGTLDSTGNSLTGCVDVALMQSCLTDDGVKPFVGDYGLVIVDECHHVSSVTFERVLQSVVASRVYGLSATVERQDALQPIIFMQCGPVRFSLDAKSQILSQSFSRYLYPRFTSFRFVSEDKPSITSLYEMLSEDEARNSLIVEDILKAIGEARSVIVLTSRRSHVLTLANMLSKSVQNVVTLLGSDSAKQKREAALRLKEISDKEPLVIVATGSYVGEGFDCPRLDTLFLALPFSWKGLITQYAGRLHRERDGKKDVRIYDYVDIHVPLLESMYRKRLKGYASIGYGIVSRSSPTLFDAVDDIDDKASVEQIFNGENFFQTFLSDISHATKSVVISSPKIHNVEKNSIFKKLRELCSMGVNVVIFTALLDENVTAPKSAGFFVKVVPNLSMCTVVIDKSIVWYGDVNVLGYCSKNNSSFASKKGGVIPTCEAG